MKTTNLYFQLHLINLTGFKKRCSIQDRLDYADEIMDDILDSADNPMEGRRWWVSSDEPWQTLAACKEVSCLSNDKTSSASSQFFFVVR